MRPRSTKGAPRLKNQASSFNLDSAYVTEARRLLQVLARSAHGADRKAYLITSAGAGEGKSTACALISVVAAQIFRKRVLLIDGDPHRPTMHLLFDIPQRPGLSDVMKQSASVDAVIRATCYPNLFAIPSGSVHGRFVEGYDDEVFAGIVQQVRNDFDLVFIDSAPIVPVVEPLLMAEHVDGILIVTMAGRTPLNIVRRMRQILAPVSSRIAGVILNNASEGLPYYYDCRYYGYQPRNSRRIRVPRDVRGSEHTEPKHPAR